MASIFDKQDPNNNTQLQGKSIFDGFDYTPNNDTDPWYKALGSGLAGVPGQVMYDVGNTLQYIAKPSYVTKEEWDKNHGDALKQGLISGGETALQPFEKNYEDNQLNRILYGIGRLPASMVELLLASRLGSAAIPTAQTYAEGAGAIAATKLAPQLAKYPGIANYVANKLPELTGEYATAPLKAIPEATMEQNDARDSYIQEAKANGTYKPGITEKEAERVGQETFEKNMALLSATEPLQSAFAFGKRSGKLGKYADTLANTALEAGVSGLQEDVQNVIPRAAAGKDWSMLDKEALEAAAIGALGAGAHTAITHTVGSIFDKGSDNKAEQPQDERAKFATWLDEQKLGENERNEANRILEEGTEEEINALKQKYGYTGDTTQQAQQQQAPQKYTFRKTPIAEGIEDTDLANTNADLKNGVDSLNSWVYANFGKDMTISGGARSPEHNAEVNGAERSHHLTGGAVDVDLSAFSDEERQAILDKAKSMGFNDDGEDMFHDKGTGLHMHLIMPQSGQFNMEDMPVARSFVDIENEIGKANAGNEYLREQLAEFNRQLDELGKDENPTADTFIKISDLQKEKSHAEEQIKANDKAIQELESEQEQIEYKPETASKEEIKARQASTTRQMDSIAQKLQKNNKKINAIRATIRKHKGRTSDRQRETLDNLDAENKELIERLKSHKATSDTLQSTYDQRYKAEDEAAAKAKAEEDARKADPFYGKSFNELADAMANNRASIREANKELEGLQAQLKEINDKGAKGDLAKASEITNKINALNNAISQVQATNKQIGDTMDRRAFNPEIATETHLKARAKYLEGSQNKIKAKIAANNKQISAIQARGAKTKDEKALERQREQIAALNKQNEELTKSLETPAEEAKVVADRLSKKDYVKPEKKKSPEKPAEKPTSEAKPEPKETNVEPTQKPVNEPQKPTEPTTEKPTPKRTLNDIKESLDHVVKQCKDGVLTKEQAKAQFGVILKQAKEDELTGYGELFTNAQKEIDKVEERHSVVDAVLNEIEKQKETKPKEEPATEPKTVEETKVEPVEQEKLNKEEIKAEEPESVTVEDNPAYYKIRDGISKDNAVGEIARLKNAVRTNNILDNTDIPEIFKELTGKEQLGNEFNQYNRTDKVEFVKNAIEQFDKQVDSLKNPEPVKATTEEKPVEKLKVTVPDVHYRIAKNDKDGVDIFFDGRIPETISGPLKENGFRFTKGGKGVKPHWWAKQDDEQAMAFVKAWGLKDGEVEFDNKTTKPAENVSAENKTDEAQQFIKDHIVVVDATPKNVSAENKGKEPRLVDVNDSVSEVQVLEDGTKFISTPVFADGKPVGLNVDMLVPKAVYSKAKYKAIDGNKAAKSTSIFKEAEQNKQIAFIANDYLDSKKFGTDTTIFEQFGYEPVKFTGERKTETKPAKPINFENAINYDVAEKNPGAIKAVFEKGEGKPAEKKPAAFNGGRAKSSMANKHPKKKVENTVFTQSEYEKRLARLKSKTTGQVNAMPMFDPEFMADLFYVGGYHFENGARKFAAWAEKVLADVKNGKPFLKTIWNSLQNFSSNEPLDGDDMQMAFEYVGDKYFNEGKTNLEDIKADLLAEEDFDGEYFVPYVNAAFAGMDEYSKIDIDNNSNNEGDVNNEPDTNGEEASGNTTEPGGEPQNTEPDARGTTGEKVNVSNSGESTQGNEETSNAGADNRPSKSVGGKPSENVSVPDENAGTNGNGGTNDTDIREGDSGNQGDERIGLSGEEEGNSGRNNDVTRVENERFSILPNGNYHVNDVNEIAGGTEAKRFAANIEALHILKAYQEEGIEPTPEQKHILAQYTGWGSFKNDSTLFGEDYDKLDDRIKEVLTKDQWLSVKKNTDSQYFTPGYVTKYIWDLAKHFGFKKGSILEPSMGVGNFFATMPVDAESDSVLTGVEIDDVAGQISKILYPDAHINVMPYEKYLAANNSHDLIVGNVPFYNGTAADGQYDKYFDSPLMIHDYFFVKGVNQLRPGGIMIAISSHGTFDKVNDEVRRYLGERAELVGAIRLPNTTFKGAGTRELTDIIVLKKRPYELDRNLVAKEPWVHVGENEIGGLNVRENQYFIEHPEMVAGEISSKKDQYGKPAMVVQANNVDAVANLNNIIEKLPKDIMKKTEGKGANEYKDANTQVGQNAVYVSSDGQLVQKKGTQEVPVPNDILANKARKADRELAIKVNKEKIQSILDINEKYDKLLEADRNNAENADELRKQAREAVEAHLKKYGYKNGFMKKVLATKQETDEEGNKSKVEYTKTVLADELQILYNVGDFSKVQKLAFLADENGNVAAVLKHKTFKKSTLNSKPSVQDSYLTQVYDGATTLDMDKLAKDADTTKEKAIKELIANNKIYQLPDGTYQPTHIYIGGNVVQKLKEAQFAYDQGNKAMERNIKALKEARPEIVPASSISVSIGAPWVKNDWYGQFLKDMVHDQDMTVVVSKKKGEWNIAWFDASESLSNAYAEQLTGIRNLGSKKIGNSYANLGVIVGKMMNKKDMVVKKKIPDPNNPKEDIWVKDEDATKALGQAIKSLNGEFNMWLFERDYDRRNEAQTLYNDTMNAIASPKYDGSGMEYEGLSTEVDGHPQIPMEHQYNAVLQGLVRGRIGCYYEAGTGKTMIMAMLCHELKRTGKASKPLVIADNRNCAIVADDFQKMYPDGKFLFIPARADDPVGATLKIGAINAEDWDAVIIPHAMVKYISFPKEIIMDLRHEELDDMRDKIITHAQEEAAEAESKGQRPGDIPGLEAFQLSNDDVEKIKNGTYKEKETPEEKQARKQSGIKGPNYSKSVRQLLQQYKKILVEIEKQAAAYGSDDSIKFDKCGFDAVMVDEVHEFRNAPKSTSHSQVKGLPTTVSTEGSAMTSVTAYINNKNNDKGVFLFSGTMIANSLPEIHTMMKWVMPDVLRESGIYNLDDFLNNFSAASVEYEPGASGELEPENRLRAFNNLPELKRIASMDIAIKRTADLPEYQPRKISTGKTAYSEVLTAEELDEIENGRVPDNQQPIGLPSKKQINVVIPNSKRLEAAQEEIKRYARMIREAQKEGANPELRDRVKNLDMNIKLQTISPLIGISLKNLSRKLRDLNTSKTTEVVANVAQEYKSNDKACQVIFLNYGWGDESTRTSTTLMPDKSGRHLTVRTKRKYTLRPYKMANDVINRLVNDYGIPREQIAVVNKATATEKAKIAERMKTGEIRIVIGSTKSLSTGINMQTNLRAVHFMQPLWLPGEYDQALKRAIRLGNRWNQVHVYHYITQGLDGKMYNAMTVKGAMIDSFTDSRNSQRTLESDALAIGSQNEMFESLADAVGDYRVLQQKQIQDKVDTYEKLEKRFASNQSEAKMKLAKLADEIPKKKEYIDGMKADFSKFRERLKEAQEAYKEKEADIKERQKAARKAVTDAEEELKAAKALKKDNPERASKVAAADEKLKQLTLERNAVNTEFTELPQDEFAVEFVNPSTGEWSVETDRKRFESRIKTISTTAKGTKYEHNYAKYLGFNVEYNTYKDTYDIVGKSGNHYSTKGTNGGSLKSRLNYLTTDIAQHETGLNRLETDQAAYKDELKQTSPYIDLLRQYQKALKDIIQDQKDNPIPPPEWFTIKAPVGLPVTYGDENKKGIIDRVSTRNDTYSIILEDIDSGEMVTVPANQVFIGPNNPILTDEDMHRKPNEKLYDKDDENPDTIDAEVEEVKAIIRNYFEEGSEYPGAINALYTDRNDDGPLKPYTKHIDPNTGDITVTWDELNADVWAEDFPQQLERLAKAFGLEKPKYKVQTGYLTYKFPNTGEVVKSGKNEVPVHEKQANAFLKALKNYGFGIAQQQYIVDENGKVIDNPNPPDTRFDIENEAKPSTEADKQAANAIIDLIKKAGIDVVTDKAEMERVLGSDITTASESPDNNTEFLKTSKGEVYGFMKNGKIYLDPDLLNPNTPVHEYTHLWDKVCQKRNPALWRKGISIMKQTALWDEVKNDPNYANIADDIDLLGSEVHSRLSGENAAKVMAQLEDKTPKGIIAKLKAWLKGFWYYTKDVLKNLTGEEIESVTQEDWANMPMVSILKGKKLKAELDKINKEEAKARAKKAAELAKRDVYRPLMSDEQYKEAVKTGDYSYMENIDQQKTIPGSVIKRGNAKHNWTVGKDIGGQLYFHKNYVDDVFNTPELKAIYEKALATLHEQFPNFKFNSICFDYDHYVKKNKGESDAAYQKRKTAEKAKYDYTVRFDEAPDFDTAREPVVGDTISVAPNGRVTEGHSDYVWHHKWLWVKNDYKGFGKDGVNKAKAWSDRWLHKIKEVADGNGIERWNAQLDNWNVEKDGEAIKKALDKPKVITKGVEKGQLDESDGSGLDESGRQDNDASKTSLNQVPAGILRGDHTWNAKEAKAELNGKAKKGEHSTGYMERIWDNLREKQGKVRNLDIGGGRWDAATNYMRDEYGVESKIFDPFSRTLEENRAAFKFIENNPVDTVTMCNVLNVIESEDIREGLVLQAVKALKPNGTAMFQIYEGDKYGVGYETSSGFQNNMQAAQHLDMIEKYFNDVEQHGNIIIAKNPKPTSKKAAWYMHNGSPEMVQYLIGRNNTQKEGIHIVDLKDAAERIVPIKADKVFRHTEDSYDSHAGVGLIHNNGDTTTLAGIVGMYLDREKGITRANRTARNEILYKATENANNSLEGEELSRYYGLPEYKKIKRGVAAFMRDYSRDKDAAKKKYPVYFNAFETMLNQPRNAKVKERVENFVKAVQEYEGLTEEGKARAAKSGKPRAEMTLKEKAIDSFNKFYGHWLDDKDKLLQVDKAVVEATGKVIEAEKDPYKQARLTSTTISNRVAALIKGPSNKSEKSRNILFDTLNRMYGGVMKHLVFFQDIIDKTSELDERMKGSSLEAQRLRNYLTNHRFKDWNDALGTYLLANRFIEVWKTKPDYTAPMTEAQARRMVQYAPKEIKEAAELYYKFDENLMNIMHYSGLLTDKGYEGLMKYKAYCPLFRDFADEQAYNKFFDRLAAPNAFANISNGIKTLTQLGSDRTVIDDPVYAMMRMTGSIISKCERNKVGQKLVALTSRQGIGGFVKKEYDAEGKQKHTDDPSQSVFTVFENGVKNAYRTTPDLYNTITGNVDVGQGILTIIEYIAKPSETLRWGATSTPGFVGGNAIMDTATGWLQSRNGFLPIIGTLHGFAMLWKNEKVRTEFELSGASIGNWRMADRAKEFEVLDEMAGHNPHWYDNTFTKQIGKIWKYWAKFNEMVENSNRIEEFYLAKKKGKGDIQAALDAKEVTTDFTRGGDYGRIANRVIPFFNAIMQGGDRMVRAIAENPQVVIPKMAALMLAGALYWARYNDEDWWKEKSNEEKLTALFLPFEGENGKTWLFRLPTPHEFGLITVGATIAALEKWKGENPTIAKDYAQQLLLQMTPSFTPAFVRPIAEVAANYDYYFNSPVEAKKYQTLTKEARIGRTTSGTAIMLGKASKAVSDATGGFIPQASPIQIDHLIRGYAGDMGKIVAHSVDSYVDGATKPSDLWDEYPIVGPMVNSIRKRFAKDKYEHPKSVDDWFDLKTALDEYHNTYEKGTKPAYMTGANKLHREILKLNKQINAVRYASGISKERKDQILEVLDQRSIQLARLGLQTFSKYKH